MIQDTQLRALAWKRAAEGGKTGTCPSSEQLEAMRKGQLSESERQGLEAHLVGCPACVDLLLVPTVPEPVVSSRQLQHILRSVGATSEAEGSAWSWLLSWRSWGVGVLVATVVLLTVMRPGAEPTSLPEYGLTLSGGVQALRGSEQALQPAELPEYVASSLVVVHLTPSRLQEQPPEAQAPQVVFYRLEGEGSWRKQALTPSLDWERETGVLRVEVEAGALFGQAYGPQALKVVVFPATSVAPDTLTDADAVPTLQLRYRPN